MTMQLIETKTLTSNVISIDFTNIPQGYTDLLLNISVRTTNSPAGYGYNYAGFKVNNTALSERNLVSDNGSVGSWTGSTLRLDAASSQNTANTFSSLQIYIPNYSNTTATKTLSIDDTFESNGGYYQTGIWAALYSSTSAITSFSYFCVDVNFVPGSMISLYGITKGSGGATIS